MNVVVVLSTAANAKLAFLITMISCYHGVVDTVLVINCRKSPKRIGIFLLVSWIPFVPNLDCLFCFLIVMVIRTGFLVWALSSLLERGTWTSFNI